MVLLTEYNVHRHFESKHTSNWKEIFMKAINKQSYYIEIFSHMLTHRSCYRQICCFGWCYLLKLALMIELLYSVSIFVSRTESASRNVIPQLQEKSDFELHYLTMKNKNV